MCGITLFGRRSPDDPSTLPPRAAALLQTMLRAGEALAPESGVKARDGAAKTPAGNPHADALAASFLVRIRSGGHGPEPEQLAACARGARRIHVTRTETPTAVVRPVLVRVSVDGELDALRLRGVEIAAGELGAFFSRVLDAPAPAATSAELLVSALELFHTQGMWLESLRLAYTLHLAPPPDRAQPALPRSELERWTRVAEECWTDACTKFVPSVGGELNQALARHLAGRLTARGWHGVPAATLLEFTQTAVDAFLYGDLLAALLRLEPLLVGAFDAVVQSSLEADQAVVLARRAPLSIGVAQDIIAVGEHALLDVAEADGERPFFERLELDPAQGRVALLTLEGASASARASGSSSAPPAPRAAASGRAPRPTAFDLTAPALMLA